MSVFVITFGSAGVDWRLGGHAVGWRGRARVGHLSHCRFVQGAVGHGINSA